MKSPSWTQQSLLNSPCGFTPPQKKALTGGSWLPMKTFYHSSQGSHVAHPFWVNMAICWKTNMEMGMPLGKTHMFHPENHAFEKANHLPSTSIVEFKPLIGFQLRMSWDAPRPRRHPPRYVSKIKESQHIHLSKKLDLHKNQGIFNIEKDLPISFESRKNRLNWYVTRPRWTYCKFM